MIKMFAIPTFEGFEEKIGLNARQISLLLISISIILWTISMLFSKMEIGSYGLINGINPLFFVSMSLIIISFFVNIQKNIENNFLLVLHLIMLIVFTSLIPVLIEGTPRFPYNYQTSQNVDFILQFGHSNANIIGYQSWPGIFYFGTIENLITNISPIDSILIIPLLFIVVNTLLSYLLFSTFLKKKETWMALLLNNALIFGSPIYFLPGVLGIMMITFALVIFFRFNLFTEKSSFGSNIIFIIFCGSAIISHFLNSVYLFMTLIFLSGLSWVLKDRRRLISIIKDKFNIPSFNGKIDKKFILVFVLIATFQIYVAGSYALDTLTGSVHDALDLEKTVDDVKNMAYSGSQAHTNVVNVRIISTLVLVILAVLGFFYEFLYRKKLTFKNLTLPTWVIANFSVSTLTSYSGEIINRTFAASISVFYILAAKLTDSPRLSCLLLIFLIISPPISVINAYGNEAIDYVSPIEISGANFLIDHSSNSSAIESLNYRVWPMRYTANLTYVNIDPESSFEENNIIKLLKQYNYVYILIGNRDKADYSFQHVNPNFNQLHSIQNNTFYNKIFDANEFELYMIGG